MKMKQPGYNAIHDENDECERFGCRPLVDQDSYTIVETKYPEKFITSNIDPEVIEELSRIKDNVDGCPGCAECQDVAKIPDEVRVTSESGGQKGSKQARIGSLDPLALMEVAKVAGFGEIKYARLNYMKGYEWSLSYDAMQRHLHAFWSGEDTDPESGLPHLAHAAWHCLALMAFTREHPNYDDRYKHEDLGS